MTSLNLKPWQQDVVDKLYTDYKNGKKAVVMTGRQIGKNIWTNKAIERLMEDLQNRPIEALVVAEGKVFGARYFTVEPIGGNWLEMEEWCSETFGQPAEVWNLKDDAYIWPKLGRWYVNSRRFWFREAKDRDWFVIRWNA